MFFHFIKAIFLSVTFVYFSLVQAAVLSPNSKELQVKFSAQFITASNEDIATLIKNHYQHFFGYFHSKTVVRDFGYNPKYIEGVGAPQMPLQIRVISDKSSKEYKGYRQISYSAQGSILFLHNVAEYLLQEKKWSITLPFDLDAFYKESCTDKYYSGIGDFWYYYDPFRRGCDFLQREPLALPIELEFKSGEVVSADTMAELMELRGDNGNGELFDVVTVNGFATEYQNDQDEGRWAFEEMNAYLIDLGFKETYLARYENRPIIRYEKIFETANGKKINFRVTRLLAETSITKKNVTFAKFFKQAIETADVVIYSGHSGLGGNLDLSGLEEKAGAIQFAKSKKQIFFFDGCASYSYYLQPFQTPNKNIKILSNALSSLFETETMVHQELFRFLLDVNSDATWMQIMQAMESVLGQKTFMLNVGNL